MIDLITTGGGGKKTDFSVVTATPNKVDSRYKFLDNTGTLKSGTLPISSITALASDIANGKKGLSSAGALITGTLKDTIGQMGFTKYAVKTFSFSSDTSISTTITHSHGSRPTLALIFQVDEIKNWNNSIGDSNNSMVLFMAISLAFNKNAIDEYNTGYAYGTAISTSPYNPNMYNSVTALDSSSSRLNTNNIVMVASANRYFKAGRTYYLVTLS